MQEEIDNYIYINSIKLRAQNSFSPVKQQLKGPEIFSLKVEEVEEESKSESEWLGLVINQFLQTKEKCEMNLSQSPLKGPLAPLIDLYSLINQKLGVYCRGYFLLRETIK